MIFEKPSNYYTNLFNIYNKILLKLAKVLMVLIVMHFYLEVMCYNGENGAGLSDEY
jgi:hypothetical protein